MDEFFVDFMEKLQQASFVFIQNDVLNVFQRLRAEIRTTRQCMLVYYLLSYKITYLP